MARACDQHTPRVRSDRVVSVSEHVWVSMETDRIDRWRFGSVVALPDDALVRGSTRFDAPTWRRLCRRAKDTFERPGYVCEQSR